jgi:hypothetical protein
LFTVFEKEEPFLPSKGWAEMIRKVYEIDPLVCRSCGGQMRIISFIEDYKVIDMLFAYSRAASFSNGMVWRFWLICNFFLVVDLIALGLIISFQDARGWK